MAMVLSTLAFIAVTALAFYGGYLFFDGVRTYLKGLHYRTTAPGKYYVRRTQVEKELEEAKRVLSVMSKGNPNRVRWEYIERRRDDELRELDGDIEEYYITQAENKMLEGE